MINREEWLKETFDNLMYWASNHECTLSRQVWHSVGMVEKDVKLSCGFGYNCRGGKDNCKVYTPDQSTGGKWEVFINPTIDNAEDARQAVWDAMRFVHKIVEDRRVMLRVDVPGGDYCDTYPHESLDVTKIKKQNTRMLKAECTDTNCGFTFRTTRLHLQRAVDAVGGVACPVCQHDMDHDPLAAE